MKKSQADGWERIGGMNFKKVPRVQKFPIEEGRQKTAKGREKDRRQILPKNISIKLCIQFDFT